MTLVTLAIGRGVSVVPDRPASPMPSTYSPAEPLAGQGSGFGVPSMVRVAGNAGVAVRFLGAASAAVPRLPAHATAATVTRVASAVAPMMTRRVSVRRCVTSAG